MGKGPRLFERGLTLLEIVERDDIQIKSRGSISKWANSEGWTTGKRKQTNSKKVLVKQDVKAIWA